MQIATMITLSQELLVFWVTARLNTIMETMVMTKPSAHAQYASFFGTYTWKYSIVPPRKANFRRTNVATKLKLTYVRDNFLDVSFLISLTLFLLTRGFVRSRSSTKLVSWLYKKRSILFDYHKHLLFSSQGTTGPIASSFQRFLFHLRPSLVSQL